MEQNVPGHIWLSQEYKKDTFYDASRPLYLEIDASGLSFGAGLLQVREGMNCGHDEVPDNLTLHPITFYSKCLMSTEQ